MFINNIRNGLGSLLLWSFVGVGLLGCCQQAIGQERVEKSVFDQWPSDMFYRAVKINQADLDAVLKGYLPVNRQSFYEMVDAINTSQQEQTSLSDGGAAIAVIREAAYYARLQSQSLVNGKGWLSIDSSVSTPTRMPLVPLSIALESPQWDLAATPAENSISERDAITGVTSLGKPILVVPQSGELEFQWTASGWTLPGGSHRFGFAVPNSASTVVIIDLPDALILRSTAGVVWAADQQSEWTLSDQRRAALPELAENYQRWFVQLGTQSTSTLTMEPRTAEPSEEKLNFYSQEFEYAVRKNGIEVTAQIRIDSSQPSEQGITVELDLPLKLISVQYGELDLPVQWSAQFPNRFDVVVPPDVTDTLLHIHATFPFTLGQSTSLPSIRMRNGVWRQGQINLLMKDGLRLQRLAANGAVERRVELISGNQVRVLEMFEPSPDISITADVERAELHAMRVSRYVASDQEIQLETEIQLTSSGEVVHEFNMALEPDWHVVSVVCDPENQLEQFVVTSAENQTGDGQTLALSFREGVGLDHPVTLKLILQKPIVAGTFMGKQLSCLSFEKAQFDHPESGKVIEQQHLIGISAEQPAVLTVTNASALAPYRLTPQSSELNDISLLQDIGFAYKHHPSIQNARFTVSRVQQAYGADVRSTLELKGNMVDETVHLTIMPDDTQVNRLLIRTLDSQAGLMTWTRQGTGFPSSRTATNEDESEYALQIVEQVVGQERLWEIGIPDPQGTPFVLIGRREIPLEGFSQLPLYRLPAANDITGKIDVRWGTDNQIDFQGCNLERTLPEQSTGASRFCQAFVYGLSLEQRSEISVRQTVGEVHHWVWTAHMHSRHLAHGQSLHEVRYVVENRGDPFLNVELPKAVELTGIHVNNVPVYLDLQDKQSGEQHFQIPLDPLDPLSQVTLRFTAQRTALGFVQTLDQFAPKLMCRVLDKHWSLAIPPGYELVSFGNDMPSVTQRLFGPWLGSQIANEEIGGTGGGLQSSGPRVAQQLSMDRLAEVLERSAQQLSTSNNALPPLTWSMWLENYRRRVQLNTRLPELVVDVLALQHSRIHPASVCKSDVPVQSPLMWLRDKQLALILLQDKLLLTTNDWFVGKRESEQLVRQASHRQQQLLRMYDMATGSFVSLDAWILSSFEEPLRDAAEASSLRAALQQDQLWMYESGIVAGDEEMVFQTFHIATRRAMSWASFIGWLGLFLLLVSRRWQLCFLFPPLTAGIAMLLPVTLMEFGSQAFLASLVTLVVLLVVRTRKQEEGQQLPNPDELEFMLQLNPRVVSCVLWLVFSVLVSDMVQAYQPPPVAPVENQPPVNRVDPPKVYDVLMPVDEEQQPYGEYVYLPESFYQKIRKRYAGLQKMNRDWIMTSAAYELKWISTAESADTVQPLMTGTYEMATTEAAADVVLPFWKSECVSVRLREAGQEIKTNWHSSGIGLQFQLAESGTHELTVTIEPRSEQISKNQLSLHLPPVADSSLVVQQYSEDHHIVITGNLGVVAEDLALGQKNVKLGSTDMITVLWSTDEQELSANAILEVSQFQWLDIAPHSVTLDVRLQFDVLAGSTQQFSLQVDPRLKLLPIQAGQVVSETPRIQEGDPTTIHFTLERPVADQFEVQLKFYLDEVSGIGNISAPRIQPIVQRSNSLWMGMSVHEELNWQSDEPVSDSANDRDKLESLWNRTGTSVAIFHIDDENYPTITTTPRVTTTAVDQYCDITVDLEKMVVRYYADLEVRDNTILQHRFRIPRQLKVESASLFQNGLPLEAEVNVTRDGYLTVFVNQGLTGFQTFELRGVIALDSGTTNVPVVTLDNADVLDERIRLFYTEGVLLRILKPQNVQLPLSTSPYSVAHQGRLVADFESANDARSCKLRVLSNALEYQGELATGLFVENDQWKTRITGSLQIINGELDTFRMSIRNVPIQALRVSPEFHFEEIVNSENESWIVLRPKDPQQRQYDFFVEFDVETESGVLRVPVVRLLDESTHEVQQFVYVPLLDDTQQPIQWEVRGVQKLAKWSSRMIPAEIETATYDVFQVLANADIHSTENLAAGGQGVVTLADYEVTLTDPRQMYAIARYYLVPTNQEEFVLSWPNSLELIGVSVHGVPVRARVGVSKTLHIPLQSNTSFHEVEVVFTATLDRAVGSRATPLVFPVPDSIVVLKSVVTANVPHELFEKLELDSLSSVSPEWIVSEQLQAKLRLWQSHGKQIQGADSEYWNTQKIQLQRRTRGLQNMATVKSMPPLAELVIQQSLTQWGGELDDLSIEQHATLHQQSNAKVVAHAVIDGQARQVIVIGEGSSRSDNWWMKLMAVCLIGSLMGVAYWGMQQGWLTNWIALVPLGPPVILGTVWWLFFASGILGGLLIALCLLVNIWPNHRLTKVQKRKTSAIEINS